jgi:hypothetical protein
MLVQNTIIIISINLVHRVLQGKSIYYVTNTEVNALQKIRVFSY